MAKEKTNRIALETGFCITIFVLHLVGTIPVTFNCAGKLLFGEKIPATWWDGLAAGVAVVFVHYVLLWFGYKKKLLDRYIIRALRAVDLFVYGNLLAFMKAIIYRSFPPFYWWHVSLENFLKNEVPIAGFVIIAVLLRIFSTSKMLAGLKAEQEGDPPSSHRA